MIKKFTTFLAAMVALLALSFNAGAQTERVTGFKKAADASEGLYMLVVDWQDTDPLDPTVVQKVLSVNDQGYLQVVNSDDAVWQNAVWCITVTPQTGDSRNNATYTFDNQGTGLPLSISLSDFANTTSTNVPLGGSLGVWSFSELYGEDNLDADQPLYLYYEGDDLVYIAEAADGSLYLKTLKNAKRQNIIDEDDFAKITLTRVNDKVLTEKEFNTVLGLDPKETGVKLTFDKDVAGGFVNPFNNTAIFAEGDITIGTDLYHYLYKKVGNTKQYLASAKAYTNEVSSTLNFNDWEWVSATEFAKIKAENNADELGRFQFKLTFSPTEDNLYIQIRNVFEYKGSGDITKTDNWQVLRNDDDNTVRTNLYVSTEDAGRVIGDDLRLITINTLTYKQNTTVKFGSFTCSGSTNRTTITDGVYHIIRVDEEGNDLYYASPIYRDGGVFEWVEVDAVSQDPAHMPAYQWIVLQTTRGDKQSTIRVINREYPIDNSGSFSAQRIVKGDEDGFVTIANNPLFNNVKFVPVGKEALNNKKLGYAHFAEDSLLVSRYLFNYYNPYTDTRYMSKPKDQTILNVFAEENVSSFTLKSFKYENDDEEVVPFAYPFGYQASKAELDRISGLVNLERTAYTISLDGDNYSKTSNGTYYEVNEEANELYVFLKENNHYTTEAGRENHYYTIIEAGFTTVDTELRPTYLRNLKAGVDDAASDARLKVETLSEKRTSSFAVIADDRPLYRRFNGVGGGERNEVATDRRDTLEFQEFYRGEVLAIESNPKFNGNTDVADILGIDYKNEFLDRNPKAKFGFVVDTAWVKRGRGVVKPQYLISIERDDFLGSAETPCPIDPSPEHQAVCHHYKPAIPAFNRGKYLINFSGIAAELGDHYSDIYRWNDRFNRAGFVHAIHRGDSLYILLADKYNFYDPKVTNETIDFATIVKEGEASYAKATDRPVVIVNLEGDEHKFVTWSMRYYDPENWYNDSRFLIESLKLSNKVADDSNGRLERQPDIAPTYAEWLKSNNGVLVLSVASESKFDEVITNGDDALIFNVNSAIEDGVATDNDKVTTTEVKVIASEGKVTVLNAAGKKVVVSNVLGQTVANTVLSSDNASIAAPKGIVVVAVEGEDAVKAIVK